MEGEVGNGKWDWEVGEGRLNEGWLFGRVMLNVRLATASVVALRCRWRLVTGRAMHWCMYVCMYGANGVSIFYGDFLCGGRP